VTGNRVVLSGQVAAVEPVRFSPAGVPSVRFTLQHASRQVESGHPRDVQVSLRVVAVGDTADAARRLREGDEVEVQGFLARASHRSEWPVLHATELKSAEG
jgi:primosomal replication protein N